MEYFSSLEQNIEVLSRLMVDLKLIKHQVATREGRDMDGWLEKVEGMEHELDKIRKEFEILAKQSDVINLKALETFSQNVIENLKVVNLLEDEGNASIESSPVHSNKMEHKTFSHEALIKFTSQFAKNIGSGGFSNVYKGQLDDGKQVAVKVLKNARVIGDFVAEMQTVIVASHTNLVTLYGFCFDYNMKALVYKFMENGSLEKVLFNNHLSLEWGKLYGIALETAKGLTYLHDGCAKHIIHRDIKPSNVLLDENLTPKITDFGLAKLISKDAKHYTITKNQGTPGYIAPEFGNPTSKITKKCDVYSFGVMLFEILGKRRNGEFGTEWFPLEVWTKFEKGQLDELIESFGIPEIHKGKAKILSMVAFWCAQFTVELRPSMSTVVEILEKEIPVNTPPHPFMYRQLQSPRDFPMLPSQKVILEIHPEASPVSRERDQVAGRRRPEMDRWLQNEKDIEDELNGGSGMLTGDIPNSIAVQQAQEPRQTANNSGTGVASESNMFTFIEVSNHNNLKDCWLLINDKVYDVTEFLGDHPGGSEVLLKAAGKDATTDFKNAHSHSSNALTMMDKFYVGVCDSIASSLSKLARDKLQLYSRVQLKEFTKDFSHPIGRGGFGDVYKGQFSNGVFMAVKVLKNIEFKEEFMEKQFVAEIETMGRAYHHNIIRLYGCCYEANTKFKALVYDYMENGSLDIILFEKKVDLPWAKLHNIAKEIAQVISYLHESCFPQIIHQDIKPSNVLFDSNFSPKVKNFGLAKLLSMGESEFEQSTIKGSYGYMAPEVNSPQKVKLNCKVDVFSFGMMLFDILGSKRNYVMNRNWFPGQVWGMYKKNQLDMFILECGIKEEDKENAKRLAIIALLCVEHNPQGRPMLSDVVKMIEGKVKQLNTPVAPFYPNYICCESWESSWDDSRDY